MVGAESMTGLYRPDPERPDTFIPSPVTMGPWRPDAQHGGPPSALLTYLCEQLIQDGEHLARITVDLLTGIPLEPLTTEATRTGVSRRVAHISATLHNRGRPVARAKAVVLAEADVPPPDWRPEPVDLPVPETLAETVAPLWAVPEGSRPFHRFGIEHRFVSGAFAEPGPAVDWVRLRQPVVDGTPPSGYQQLVGVTDIGSGISAVYDPADGVGLINADLDVAFVDRPRGPWFALLATTEIGRTGTGTAITRIADIEGRVVAVATQSLLGSSIDLG